MIPVLYVHNVARDGEAWMNAPFRTPEAETCTVVSNMRTLLPPLPYEPRKLVLRPGVRDRELNDCVVAQLVPLILGEASEQPVLVIASDQIHIGFLHGTYQFMPDPPRPAASDGLPAKGAAPPADEEPAPAEPAPAEPEGALESKAPESAEAETADAEFVWPAEPVEVTVLACALPFAVVRLFPWERPVE